MWSRQYDFNDFLNELSNISFDKNIFNSRKSEYIEFSKKIENANTLNQLSYFIEKMLDDDLYPDTIIFNQIIKKLGRLNQIQFARSIYDIAYSNNLVDVFTHASMIIVAGKNKRIDFVIHAYHRVIDLGIVNIFIENSVIEAAGKNNRMDIAIDVYEHIIREGIANAFTYNSYIDAALKNNRIDLVAHAYENANREGVSDVFTHNCIIEIFGKNNDFEFCITAYKKAICEKIATAFTYNCMIKAAGRNGRIDWALYVYREAIENGFANSCTHNLMISMSGRNGCIEKAIEAYQRSIEFNAVDTVTCLHMIVAAGNCGHIVWAHDAYDRAIASNLLNEVMQYSMIDALFKNNHESMARQLCSDINFKILINSGPQDDFVIDLHGLNYATTYIGLSSLIDTTEDSFQAEIIYGKGLHSKNQDKIHIVKQAAIDAVRKSSQDYQVELVENTQNAGRALLTVTLKCKKQNRHYSSCLFSPEPDRFDRTMRDDENDFQRQIKRQRFNG